jgi:hypothetical protein
MFAEISNFAVLLSVGGRFEAEGEIIRKETKPELEEAPPVAEMAALLIPLANLAGIGLQRNKEPKEIVRYFVQVVEEFMNRMGELAEFITP